MSEWPGKQLSAWAVPSGSEPVYVERDHESKPRDTATAFIQWKGTNVCLDFHCVCGADGHIDEDFAYSLECSACGKTFAMPHTVEMLEQQA